MKRISALMLVSLVALSLSACHDGRIGRYAPVSNANELYLVDTETGQTFKRGPVYRDGGDPTPPKPAKWELAVQF